MPLAMPGATHSIFEQSCQKCTEIDEEVKIIECDSQDSEVHMCNNAGENVALGKKCKKEGLGSSLNTLTKEHHSRTDK